MPSSKLIQQHEFMKKKGRQLLLMNSLDPAFLEFIYDENSPSTMIQNIHLIQRCIEAKVAKLTKI